MKREEIIKSLLHIAENSRSKGEVCRAAAEMLEKSRWISVEEKLPEDCKELTIIDTKEEIEYIQERWGEVTIPKIAENLGRSINAVKVKSVKLGLRRHLHGGD